MPSQTARGVTVVLGGAALGLAAALGAGTAHSPVAAATGAAHTVAAPPVVPMVGFFNGFEAGAAGWCDQPSATTLGFGPCDGSAHGTIRPVAAGTTVPSGAYAAGPLAAGTGGAYAVVTGAPNSGGACSTSVPLTPCRGPYTDWGQTALPGAQAFPAPGLTTEIDVYLDPSWAAANPDMRFDWSVRLHGADGHTLGQYVFNVGSTPAGYAGGTGFAVDASTASGRAASSPEGNCPPVTGVPVCGRPVVITTPGWYRLIDQFFVYPAGPVGANLVVVSAATGAPVPGARWTPYAVIPAVSVAGVSGAFPNEEIPGLPVDNSQLAVGGLFAPMAPARVCDTRAGNPSGLSGPAAQCKGGPASLGHTLGPGDVLPVRLAGVTGLPASGLTAVVMDVTAYGQADVPATGSAVTGWADEEARPGTTSLTADAGRAVSVEVVTAVGPDGVVDLYNSAGHVDLTVDVQGYYTASAPDGFGAVGPSAVCDTVPGNPRGLSGTQAQCNGGPSNAGAPLGPGESRRIEVAGVGPVPARAAAVVLEITAAGHPDVPTGGSSLTAWPDGLTPPAVTDLSYGAGQVVSNQVTVPVGTDGAVEIHNAAGHVDVVVDAVGWYGASAIGVYFAAYPTRICDTRPGNPSGLGGVAAGCGGGPGEPGATLGSDSTRTLAATGPGGPVAASSSTVTQALVQTLTAVAHDIPPWGTALTTWAGGGSRPADAPLVDYPGLTASGLATTPASPAGAVAVYNAFGPVDLIVDTAGFFFSNPLPVVSAVGTSAPPPVSSGVQVPPPSSVLAFTGPQGPPVTASPPTGTTAAPTAEQLKASCISSIADELNRQLSYKPRQRMEVGRVTPVEAVLGTGSVPTVPGGVVVTVPTTCEVDATLRGDGFDIVALSPEKQSFVNASVLTWQWDVTPTRAGPDMQLTLNVQSDYGGGLGVVAKPQGYVANISVLAAPESLVHRASSIIYNPFLDALLSSGLLAIGLGVVRERWKEKQRKAEKELVEEAEAAEVQPTATRSAAKRPAAKRPAAKQSAAKRAAPRRPAGRSGA